MPAVPTSEPAVLTAGDTIAWTRTLPDYPASAYVLKYALQAPAKALIGIQATASGDTHSVNVPAATSATWSPGRYILTPYVEQIADSTVRHIFTDAVGEIQILPSPLSALATSKAAQILALIQDALIGRIPRGLESTNIDGQELSRIPIEGLQRLENKYLARVNLEAEAARSATGLKTRRSIGIKFVKP